MTWTDNKKSGTRGRKTTKQKPTSAAFSSTNQPKRRKEIIEDTSKGNNQEVLVKKPGDKIDDSDSTNNVGEAEESDGTFYSAMSTTKNANDDSPSTKKLRMKSPTILIQPKIKTGTIFQTRP